MADARFALALGNFDRALTRLHQALALPENEIVRDALIQRFEFTFETGWQAAYWWLQARGANVAKESFAVLPRAFTNGLIADEGAWNELRQKRNLTSHTYQEQVAVDVAAFVRARGVRCFDELLAVLKARADE
ncbi:MAG: nucleotidyltransferase substrate binding protein [Burkholderiales bacterium]|jgi:nucleotidyltransferase substrate binding protein (TIGR01987 family)|nr:nucleotidyltransferase substrate binding protein [Burkholderiales bacterium]MCL4690054.1 HI0074 family nucleotidyltransferase substrate-binding subunit [Burkholderiales bacterium]